jgi:hypothetical protein
MPNFAWIMADFALLFPEHIMGLFMLALLCLSIITLSIKSLHKKQRF